MSNYILVRKKWLRDLQRLAESSAKAVEAMDTMSELDKAMVGLQYAQLQGFIQSAESIHKYQPKSLRPVKRVLVYNHEKGIFEYELTEESKQPIPWVD